MSNSFDPTKEFEPTECIIDESHTYEQFNDNEPHSSDCAYWVEELCDCIMSKPDIYDMRDDG